LQSTPASSNVSTATHSRQSSEVSSSASDGESNNNIIEQIAYATSPSKDQPPSDSLRHQIQSEANGAKLLLTTLLCNKIRREYVRLTREHADLANRVLAGVINALLFLGHMEQQKKDPDWKLFLGACSSAVAAAAVRTNDGIRNIIHSCKVSIGSSLGMAVDNAANMPSFSPTIALKLLADIPGEAASRNDVTKSDIDSSLQITTNPILDILHASLNGYINGGGEQQDVLLCSTLSALAKWAEANTDISLSRLLDSNILERLVALLSSQLQQRQWSNATHAEDAITKSASALMACIDNPSPPGSLSRKTAVASLLASIPSMEFLLSPLAAAKSQQWDNATIALSNLASAFAREEIDEIATCRLPGCSDLVELLLELQAHELHSVAVPVLEVWINLQDVEVGDRHPTMAAPLYQQLTEVIMKRVAYPPTFRSWEEELDLEATEFDEMRRLSTDVLVGAYFILRSGYLECLANVVMGDSDWEIAESALFCMCAVGREACARVKSVKNVTGSGRNSPVAADGDATSMGLTQVASSICAGGAAGVSKRHPLVLSAVAIFLGCYSPVWASTCPPQTILEIVTYLNAAMSIDAAQEAAGKSIRLVLIASAGKLARAAGSSPVTDLSPFLTGTMEAALASNDAQAMASVAEGCARVCVQLRDKSKARVTLHAVASLAINRARSALDVVTSASAVEGSGQSSGQIDAARQAISSYLGVLRELVRYCDGSPCKAGEVHVVSDILATAWPLLNDISSNNSCRTNEAVLSSLLAVHSQLFGVAPSLIGPYFKDIVTFAVKAYEESFCAAALTYVGAAVETFDIDESIGVAAGLDQNGKITLFNQLLSHVCQHTFAYVSHTRVAECPEIIEALFEMAQRYLLFCPEALFQSPSFETLFLLGVDSLKELQGEVKSTRAILIFITQLFGWKHIRLSDAKMAILTQYAGAIDNLLVHKGEAIIKNCLGALSGGAPQILWPPYSECLFSITQHIISTTPGAGDLSSALCTWLRHDMANTQNITPEIATSVISLLCDLAKEGANSKQKAKMMMADYGKIAKGEATPDVLLAYSTT